MEYTTPPTSPGTPSPGTPAGPIGGGDYSTLDATSEPTTIGMDPKLAGLLAYVFGWISGLIIFLMEKQNRVVRFHALQSIFLGIAIFVVYIALMILSMVFGMVSLSMLALVSILYLIVGIGVLVLWIVTMIKGYSGKVFLLPIIGPMAAERTLK